MNPQDCVRKEFNEKKYENHIAGKGSNSLHHYNSVHKFVLMSQALKTLAAKTAVDKKKGKTEENSGVESVESQKQISGDR